MKVLIDASGRSTLPPLQQAAEADLVILVDEKGEPFVWKYREGPTTEVDVKVIGDCLPTFARGRR